MECAVMDRVRFDCDFDLVLEMQEMQIGVEEILQYAKGVFSREQARALIQGLEEGLEERLDEINSEREGR